MCASAAFGFFIHSRLPETHRTPQSIALVQLAITLLVTFTAIVLGLLTTSVKAGFDAAYSARGDDAAQLAQLDRCLRDYGPETAPIREQLRGYVAAVIASTWPDEPRPFGVAFPDPSKMPLIGQSPVLSDVLSNVGLEVRSLKPADAVHERVLADCDQQYSDLIKARWKVIEGTRGSDLGAPLLGSGDLACDPVWNVWPDGAAQCDGGDGDGFVRALDHDCGLRHPRYGRTLRRTVRSAQHLNAQRARRHDARRRMRRRLWRVLAEGRMRAPESG